MVAALVLVVPGATALALHSGRPLGLLFGLLGAWTGPVASAQVGVVRRWRPLAWMLLYAGWTALFAELLLLAGLV